MKILNIDAFVTPKRQLTLKGKTYDCQELSTQAFIENLKAVESLEAARKRGEGSVSEYLELTIKSVLDAVPTLPPEELRKLPPDQVALIAEFVRGDYDPETVGASASNQEGAEAKKD